MGVGRESRRGARYGVESDENPNQIFQIGRHQKSQSRSQSNQQPHCQMDAGTFSLLSFIHLTFFLFFNILPFFFFAFEIIIYAIFVGGFWNLDTLLF